MTLKKKRELAAGGDPDATIYERAGRGRLIRRTATRSSQTPRRNGGPSGKQSRKN